MARRRFVWLWRWFCLAWLLLGVLLLKPGCSVPCFCPCGPPQTYREFFEELGLHVGVADDGVSDPWRGGRWVVTKPVSPVSLTGPEVIASPFSRIIWFVGDDLLGAAPIVYIPDTYVDRPFKLQNEGVLVTPYSGGSILVDNEMIETLRWLGPWTYKHGEEPNAQSGYLGYLDGVFVLLIAGILWVRKRGRSRPPGSAQPSKAVEGA